ncbi:hypothetical protein RE428_10370 [Marinobacter nanhaiticus D15-8W]|uniref:Uncharacterized protein n=1 Tax=Marinobacter nanhaiticus D15-8W TaxID=626887 RepID=N6VR64_9GAMM|nr:hypothetical protein [Marinobacter nanhaiticus]ENO12680.1 hypothetical protein J057_14800 [Marinobacter nanhaiticus D15-8W]BES70019.1 hypothetical protein RE428_10370 [Marinobacter nanhaiticus D15-8W]
MDPVSYLFSAYLNTVQTNVQEHFAERYGTQITPVEIQYEGVEVAFQHQLWRIRDKSVCGNVSHNLKVFSECTLKAKQLFGELCSELSKAPQKNWKHGKFRTMYCNASVSFRPTIARVSAGTEETELAKARQACNAATVAAMGSREPGILREKRELCWVYESLKLR